mgnify:CR=1 FL=1
MLSDRIIAFNEGLSLSSKLPSGIDVMNPFRGDHAELIARLTRLFYNKYYNDDKPRKLILGINPGRLGAGLTGIPFTDTKRLKFDCGIDTGEIQSHEPSSVFVYEVIKAFGGPDLFYSNFFINSICPLGFIYENDKGKWVNYNYYDRKDLEEAVTPFILESLKKQISLGLDSEQVWIMGSGKNMKFIKALNKKHKLFDRLIALDHPRFVMQYRYKRIGEYVEKYLQLLNG